MSVDLNVEEAVASRYSSAAAEREAALCCPVTYNPDLLKIIPQEIIDRDYGCGDPSPFVRPGDTVVDLGSGGGKLCYIASQLVGAEGKVIGVDCNREMLGLARQYQSEIANKLGYANVDFRCGLIQNLSLDLELLARELESIQATGVERILHARQLEQKLSTEQKMIADDSVDCVVSNCVLNLVQPNDRRQLFREVFRVLKNGGRAAISDIVSDEDIPAAMRADPTLWSGCISGAWREDEFLDEFYEAGFHGITIEKLETQPWQTIQGIEFRSMTVVAYKGKAGPCLDRNQALIYRGPFKKVEDDDGHTYFRGQRMAVCDKTFKLLQQAPYAESFLPVEPIQAIPLNEATPFDCRQNAIRMPRDTKGADYAANSQPDPDVFQLGQCDADGPCC